MDKNSHTVSWFEIPATDIGRAREFYEAIFDIEMQEMPMPELKMVTFPMEMGSGHVHGALCQHEMYEPSANGVTVYLNANPDIQAVLDRIEPAGGKIVLPRTQISEEIGYMALFMDSEGNRVALHAAN
ncbi:MAG: VOC family protein [Acidobacteria bacterium]|nr:MAG: VOC family protein [Acidobacteriota bacterium]REJ98146.1 MAG: VOC family protein [Acidobacteriota bacterium]REK16889.1 MAG: VOC family protein [Acidobacteriota bacterium]REK42800.1 MAG: VOC family protein [Acidobacteriota bacterium]